MSEDKQILRKALISTTVMFVMTSLGHVIVYFCNKDKEGVEE